LLVLPKSLLHKEIGGDDEPVVSKLWMWVKAVFKGLLQHLLM